MDHFNLKKHDSRQQNTDLQLSFYVNMLNFVVKSYPNTVVLNPRPTGRMGPVTNPNAAHHAVLNTIKI